MGHTILLGLMLAVTGPILASDGADQAKSLRVVYVGNKDTDRERSYSKFLSEYFSLAGTAERRSFDPGRFQDADVVVLDWSQGDIVHTPGGRSSYSERDLKSPLGERDSWRKPTVLLGSAGHLIAAPWKVFGGSGCTCLDPFAYGLRDHPVFRTPLAIDQSKMIRRPWPTEWHKPHDGNEIAGLPLIRAKDDPSGPGWCTYTEDMAEAPEVEVFCGGINSKGPTLGALWRQGNLLHYGFDLSPGEMNEWGKAMLVDAISYIARFTEDRPIMHTPSPFAGQDFITRTEIERIIAGNDPGWWGYLRAYFDPGTLEVAGVKDLTAFAKWFTPVRDYLHPNPDGLMSVDPDSLAEKLDPSRRAFFDQAITTLAGPGEKAERCRRMLERYVPEGPGPNAHPQAWADWWQANTEYLFFGEAGGYRWYLDPLAKARAVPTASLRGVARASR